MHFEEDLAGDTNSWKTAFEAAGIQMELESAGLGFNPQIIDIFCRHMEAALDVVPHFFTLASQRRVCASDL